MLPKMLIIRLVNPEPAALKAVPVVPDPKTSSLDEVVVAEPLYLHVPPEHARAWRLHCREYHACNRQVYFVKSREYEPEYIRAREHEREEARREEHYRHVEHERHEERREERREDRHEHHDHDHDHDDDHGHH